MRICIVQNVSLTGHLALSTYLRNLTESLDRIEGVNVTALVSRGYPDGWSANHLEVLESRTNLYSLQGNLFFVFWSLFTLWRTGRKNRINLIHCLYPSSSTIACILYKWMFSQKTKIVYDIRSPWIDMSLKRGRIDEKAKGPFRILAYTLERFLLKLVDGVIFITKGLESRYRRSGLHSHGICTVSPSGVDLKRFHPRSNHRLRQLLGLKAGDRIIGYAGGIAETRKLKFIIDGYEKLVQQGHRQWKLVFIGDGDDLDRLKTEVRERGINGVYFTGEVPHSDVAELIADFDVGVCHLPSSPLFDTSFPMKVLEYRATGIPVLLSDIPAHREISEYLTGTTRYGFSADDFADSVSGSTARINGDLSNVSRFSWERIAVDLLRFYSILHGRREDIL